MKAKWELQYEKDLRKWEKDDALIHADDYVGKGLHSYYRPSKLFYKLIGLSPRRRRAKK